MKPTAPTGRCAALRGTVGESVSCACYQGRPRVCREFEPGEERCNEMRRRRGLPVLVVDWQGRVVA